MAKHGLLIAMLLCGCSTPKPIPGVVQPPPGTTLEAIPGPMPNFGPFPTVKDAIYAACPLILNQPHAVIPVRPGDQSFHDYWRTSAEYCAWLYSPDDHDVEMSFLAMSAAQDNPEIRQCLLPAFVADGRYPTGHIAYLVFIHSHVFDDTLSLKDYRFLIQMAQLHGFAANVRNQTLPITAVAYFGQEHDGKATCSGFYQYSPLPDSELIKVTINDKTGERTERSLGHLRWNDNLTYTLEP